MVVWGKVVYRSTGVTLATYSVDWPELGKALEHEHALIDRDTLKLTEN